MPHPESVIEKAKKIERLLLRMEGGEAFEPVRAELGLKLKIEDLPKMQSRYAAGGRHYGFLINGQYGHYETLNLAMRAWLYEHKQENEQITAPEMVEELKKKYGVDMSAGHINYLLRKRGLTGRVGRPQQRREAKPNQISPEVSSQAVENAGIFFPGSSQTGDEGS